MGFGTLIQRITFRVSGRSAASSGLYSPQDYVYDYAVGGIPFLSATSDSRPDTEKPVQQRKQQFDAFKDPGEYSLNQWWLRSQSSFVGGEGILYQDPDTQGTSKNTRFAHSVGIDPFTDSDVIGLLKESNQGTLSPANTQTKGAMYCAQFVESSSGERCWFAAGNRVWLTTLGASTFTVNSNLLATTSTTGDHWTGGIATFSQAAPATSATTTEYALLYLSDESVAGTNSGIYRASNATTLTKAYTVAAANGGERIALASARGLLGFGWNEKFYMLNPFAVAAALPGSPNASVPVGQAIVSIVDGPDAVYVGANSRYNGYIYKTTFDTNGVVNGLTLTAVLPAGEMVNSLGSYLNSFLVISTTTGVRVGTYTGNGVVYGPNLIPVPRLGTAEGPESNSGFGRISFYGTRAYVCEQGTAQQDGYFGLMAIDLSTVNDDQNTGAQLNAYATWDYLPNTLTAVDCVTTTPTGRLVYTSGRGANSVPIVEHSVNLISQGYLDTGRCRFNTIEPKLFKYFSIKTPSPLLGDVNVALLDDQGGITNYITYGPTLDPGTNDIATPTPGGPRNWEALRFTLHRNGTDATKGGVLDSWQIKALPGTLKQRVIVRQFLCFNSEKDKSGQQITEDTGSLDRLTAIRQMCQRGDTVTLQDLVNNISDQVIIDDYDFTMMAPPGPNGENYGGYLTVTMRTVADSVPSISQTGSADTE